MSRMITAAWSQYASVRGSYAQPVRVQITPKLVFDVVVATLALLFLAPLLLLVAVAIRLESKGPILFSQVRYGWDNRPFRVYKFRSMWTHLSDARGTKQARENDP